MSYLLGLIAGVNAFACVIRMAEGNAAQAVMHAVFALVTLLAETLE